MPRKWHLPVLFETFWHHPIKALPDHIRKRLICFQPMEECFPSLYRFLIEAIQSLHVCLGKHVGGFMPGLSSGIGTIRQQRILFPASDDPRQGIPVCESVENAASQSKPPDWIIGLGQVSRITMLFLN